MRILVLVLISSIVLGTTAMEWVVQLKKGVQPNEFLSSHPELTYGGPFTPLSMLNYHVFYQKSNSLRNTRSIQNALTANHNQVEWHAQQTPKKRYTRRLGDSKMNGKRTIDPLYSQQWHLHGPFSVDADMDRHDGSGVVIGIVDDGLEWRHPEIQANYNSALSWDFNDRDGDPSPTQGDGHGTSAAGVAVAVESNGHCGKGVAPKASVVGLRTIAMAVTDATEAQALSYKYDDIDIYSCSWGPYDSGEDMEAPNALVQRVLQTYAGGQQLGRNGKGSIFVWASGNGRANQDSCAYDGYAGNPYVNAIGAIDHRGQQSYYSEGCANLMAVTPSSGQGFGITTADLMGQDGYDATECTSSFGGTSSAAPLAAGIIARILQAYPHFTWRDVRHVLAKGATKIQPYDTSWHVNAAGYHHSNKYGFGLLKIPALMRAAANHQMIPPFRSHTNPIRYHVSEIPYGSSRPLVITMDIRNSHLQFIESVLLDIYITHPKRGQLSISLISPSGTRSELAAPHPDTHRDYPRNGWTFSSLHFWGETQIDGTWTLEIFDNAAYNGRGNVQWYQLSIHGHA